MSIHTFELSKSFGKGENGYLKYQEFLDRAQTDCQKEGYTYSVHTHIEYYYRQLSRNFRYPFSPLPNDLLSSNVCMLISFLLNI